MYNIGPKPAPCYRAPNRDAQAVRDTALRSEMLQKHPYGVGREEEDDPARVKWVDEVWGRLRGRCES